METRIVIALEPAHGAGTVYFPFGQTAFSAACPGIQTLLTTDVEKYSALAADGSFSLTARISAVSIHFYHSLTDLGACRGVRIDSLQAAHLRADDEKNEAHKITLPLSCAAGCIKPYCYGPMNEIRS